MQKRMNLPKLPKHRENRLSSQFAKAMCFQKTTLALFFVSITPHLGLADLVTTNEAQLDIIFSQPSFGDNPVDIRFNPTVTLPNASLLLIDTEAKIDQLFATTSAFTKVISLFYVDEITQCGISSPTIVGCANLPGTDVVIESSAADSSLGPELIAHEMAHSLGLDHTASGSPNLLAPGLNDDTTLTLDQVAMILSSALVQTDVAGAFIEIGPVLVTAPVAVPEPSSLFFLGLASFGLFGKRLARHLMSTKARRTRE